MHFSRGDRIHQKQFDPPPPPLLMCVLFQLGCCTKTNCMFAAIIHMIVRADSALGLVRPNTLHSAEQLRVKTAVATAVALHAAVCASHHTHANELFMFFLHHPPRVGGSSSRNTMKED